MGVWASCAVIACAGVMTAGCGRPSGVVSTGTVTLDGKPVAVGSIVFQPFEPGMAPEGSMIQAGAFRVVGKAGKRRVEISASGPPPGTPDPPTGPVRFEEMIPDRYNTKSTLVVEVTASGPNRFTFDLERTGKNSKK